jgi:hypothetical protein
MNAVLHKPLTKRQLGFVERKERRLTTKINTTVEPLRSTEVDARIARLTIDVSSRLKTVALLRGDVAYLERWLKKRQDILDRHAAKIKLWEVEEEKLLRAVSIKRAELELEAGLLSDAQAQLEVANKSIEVKS